jgi:tRNA A37 threonylcarbamoyladenosine dehydratase
MEELSRASLLIGEENLEKLKKARIAVFGVGGVGGFAVECLVRSGVENITVVDADVVEKSNINRQIIATEETVGQDKVEVILKRCKSINKNAKITAIKTVYLPENAGIIDLTKFDYVIDAVDTITSKVELIKRAKDFGVKIISCMGTGKKIEPLLLKVSDISKTKVCPLAKIVRKKLRDLGIDNGVKVVYSEEESIKKCDQTGEEKTIPSMIFVPSVAGIILANEVVKDIIK